MRGREGGKEGQGRLGKRMEGEMEGDCNCNLSLHDYLLFTHWLLIISGRDKSS